MRRSPGLLAIGIPMLTATRVRALDVWSGSLPTLPVPNNVPARIPWAGIMTSTDMKFHTISAKFDGAPLDLKDKTVVVQFSVRRPTLSAYTVRIHRPHRFLLCPPR